ncbi:unnamed protein product [Rotaria socialis]|uniref:Transmembrane protein 242 n=1 Tax=Rotaria socialis TaxID=392032 RepID=A0A821H1N6_9BILA|nr:unnamed protein product [Rotaria socialis]CAF3256406.1 unnamed protein product [Rotaria socialis]CAF3558787.1 unnamed protein product [Rotaria socialis]CAF3583957.1 unnamed protein product [Rotaria socialis]CAF3670174.1 unnamed protein product [Rotaria socialis]
MASSSSSSSSLFSTTTPKLIIPDEKSPSETNDSRSSSISSILSSSVIPSSRETTTKKLTKILSTQSSLERHYPPRPIAKRFSIDADPSSIILNTTPTDFSSNSLRRQPSTPDAEENLSIPTSNSIHGKDTSPARSPSLKKIDSFLEIPYEKGEIVDLIKLADDPNASTHMTNDGHEVLLEHGAAPYDAVKSDKEASREARNAFIFNRLLPGVYFSFITACGLLGGFGFALGRTKKRETTAKLTRQANARVLFDDGHYLAIKALRRASMYSLATVLSFTGTLWLLSGKPKTFAEFRMWSASWLPSIKRKTDKENEGRIEFESVTDFMQYLIDEDKRLKDKKKSNNTNTNNTNNE